MHFSSSLWCTDCETVRHLLQSPEHGVTLITERFVPKAEHYCARRSERSSSLLPHAQSTYRIADMWHELRNSFQICFVVAMFVANNENIILNTESMPMAPRDTQVQFIMNLMYASGPYFNKLHQYTLTTSHKGIWKHMLNKHITRFYCITRICAKKSKTNNLDVWYLQEEDRKSHPN